MPWPAPTCVISGSSRLTAPPTLTGTRRAPLRPKEPRDNQQERERELEEAAGDQERDPGAVVPIHAEEIEWMSELPMKNATVNDRKSTPASTAILL